MYFQPYGNGQQLNLNWIINEIIELHKQLDPDYETPKFSQIYPYSNLEQLNLDWILSELKTLKELAPGPTPELDIQAVAEALVALPFDSTKSYQLYDFISKDGEIYRATEAIAPGGVWDETKWFKTKLGTDLAVLERWINAINASLTTLENTVDELSSADISDDSDAGGATVKASLNNLKGSLNSIQGQINAYVEDGNTASRAYGEGGYIVWKGSLYRVIAFISSGNTFTVGTNIVQCTVSTELYATNRDSGWITLYDNSPEYIKYRRVGHLIFVTGNVSSNGTQLVTKATLPTGYRPSERAFTSIESTNSTGIPNAYINIPTSGAIQLIDWEKTAKTDLYFNVVYPL